MVSVIAQPRHDAAGAGAGAPAGRGAWTRPSIQRSTEHTRGSGTSGDTATVVSSRSIVRKGAGTSRSVPARSAISQASSEPTAAAESTFRP